MAPKFLCFFLIFLVQSDVKAYKLTKVLVLGRHNIRTPLSDSLQDATPKEWPVWSEHVGYLTPKGRLQEGYMGKYFSLWLVKERLIAEGCPEKNSVYIYANAPQRTKESATAFSENAFKDCNMTVHYKENVTTDPMFHPVLQNTSEEFKQIVLKEMSQKLEGLNLTQAYQLINQILDFSNSNLCKNESFCDFAEAKDDILYEIGEEPNVKGPLALGNSVVDFFLMSFYNGMPEESIGWGEINSLSSWKKLAELTKENQNVRFNSSNLANDVAKPLLKYIAEKLLNGKEKITLLVGHDSNQNSLITAMEFKPYYLPGQLERTPIGGKIVFQKWFDEGSDRDLLKIEYVYQSTQQLRNGRELSLGDPPNRVVLELNDCKVFNDGFCLWSDFEKVLRRFSTLQA